MSTDHCRNRDDKIIVLRDERSASFRIDNAEKKVLEVCHVDGGLVCDNSKRCDKSVRRVGEWLALVELKGRDIESATEQLFQTYSHEAIRDKLEKKRVAIVVSKVVRVPRFDSFMKDQKQRFAKFHKSLFRVERDGSGLCLDALFK